MAHKGDVQLETVLLAPNICTTINGEYLAVADADTIHLIWLDMRHERTHDLRAMLTGGQAVEQNLELYYRHRADRDPDWTKEVLLCKGLDFVFAPDMAVDGDNIVVVCAGYRGDKGKTGSQFHPSDIYITTSRNGGGTWSPVIRVTNNAGSGFASGRPQVALHNGVIHLFYIQGKLKEQNVGAGLRLMNQAPWPIIYQQRLFPTNY